MAQDASVNPSAPNPEAKAFLDGLAALELPPFETMDVAVQRSIFDAAPEDGPEPPPIHSSVDRTIPGPAGDITIRILRPSDAPDLPVVVYFHGGGWVIGTIDGHDNLARAIANQAQAVVINVDYRRAPEDVYPAAFDDCAAVTAWVAANGAELGADSTRLAVGGDSAGGNLAAAVALWARDQGINLGGQLLIYPAANLAKPQTDSYEANGEGYLLTQGWMDWFIDQYLPDASARTEPYASPALAPSHAGIAPAMVITAGFDPLRDDGAAYAEKLKGAGVDVHYRHYPEQIHGFASQIGVMTDATGNVNEMAAFLTARW